MARRGAIMALGLIVSLLGTSCTTADPAASDPCINAEEPAVCRWDQQELSADNPCRLLLMSEIAEVVERPNEALPGRTDRGLCFGAYLGDLNYSYTVGEEAEARFGEVKKGDVARVGDIGMEAYWDTERRTLHVATDKGYFFIEVPALSDPKDVAVRLAMIALARIAEEESSS